MADFETYLELAPEFGGTRFGPFLGPEVRLGSDPATNDIVLPEAMGVLPQHAKILFQGEDNLVLAPVERAAGVYLFRGGRGVAKPVNAPVAIAASTDPSRADAFALVTSEGPKFSVLSVEIQKTEAKKKPSQTAQRLSGKSIFAEIKRQGFSSVLTTSVGQTANRALTFIKSGAIFRPRNLIGLAALASGWVALGGVGLMSCNFRRTSARAERQLIQCKDEMSAMAGSSGSTAPSLDKITATLLGDNEWENSLAGDSAFRAAYVESIKELLNTAPERFDWLYTKPGAKHKRLHTRMRARMPEPVARVLAYAGSRPSAKTPGEWYFVDPDSIGGKACARGPMSMTYRQGANLGLTVGFDGVMPQADFNRATESEMKDVLVNTGKSLVNNPNAQDTIYSSVGRAEQVGGTGSFVCVFEGDKADDRTDVGSLIGGLNKALGARGRGLPEEGAAFWLEARILKFHAADTEADFDALRFDQGDAPSQAVKNWNKRVYEWALKGAADTVARSVVFPCRAALSTPDEPPEHLGTLPQQFGCFVMEGIVRYQEGGGA